MSTSIIGHLNVLWGSLEGEEDHLADALNICTKIGFLYLGISPVD